MTTKAFIVLAVVLVAGIGTAKATDYVFVYNNNNYLSVNNNGQVANSTTLTAGCVWTCVSDTSTLEATSLDNSTSRYLYTIVNGRKYWLVGSTTNGTAITVTTTAPNTAYWRNDGTRLHYYSSYTYYVYYRGNTWRTSRSNGTSSSDNNLYNRLNNNGTVRTEYRSTTTAGTTQAASGNTTTTILSTPEISPATASLLYNGQQLFTASATKTATTTRIPAHSLFNTNQHYYNGILTTNTADFPREVVSVGEPTTEGITFTWAISGDGAGNLSKTDNNASTTVRHTPSSATDKTATLTVTASATGADSKNAVATINILAPTQTPTITRTGNEVTIATTSAGATIYYTVDGGTPTSSSSVYTGAFNIEDLPYPVTVKAIAIRYGSESGIATETYNNPMCAEPVITISKSGAVTITCATEGATIRYTTNGNTPNGSSTEYTGSFNVTNQTTVKAIAIKTGYDNSGVASELYLTTGISGTKLIINDLEDHNWTYYSDKPDPIYPDQLRSPDPRNVKITYCGGSFSGASSVAISTSESVDTIVYLKTIEKYAWGGTTNTTANTGRLLTGEYAYYTIPNPFLKRPRTNGATGTSGFYGFNGWKIKSGGEYINGYDNNQTIPADTKINFVNLPAGNDGNGEIVLEAQWAAATVTLVNASVTGNPNNAFSGGTFETNFVVVQGANRTVSGLTYNVTVMGCYPDGTGATNATLGNVTGNGNALKIENVNLGNGTAYTFGTGMFFIGRGCTGNVSTLYNNGSSNNIYLRVESGTFRYIHSMSKGNNNNDNNSQGRVVFGCDYDRATNDGFTQNDNESNHTKRHLRVVNYVSVSANAYHHANNDRSEHMDITVKSGFFGFSAVLGDADGGYGIGIGGNTDQAAKSYTANYYNHSTGTVVSNTYDLNGTAASSGYWQELMSFYCGTTRSGDKGGVNRVLIEGGEFNSINGGGYRPTYANANDTVVSYHFRMKGGWVKGAIYGTASASYTNATTKQVITGGEINGWIAGACNGTDVSSDNNSGWNRGNTYIYFGGTAELRSHRNDGNYNNTWGLVGGVPGGNIFASGRGCEPGNTNYNYCGSSNHTYTVVADKAKVEQSVYGGGYIGVAKRSHIFITGGEIGQNVYGGASSPLTTSTEWRTSNTDIRMYGGLVKGGIYGGHYLGTNDAGKIHGDVHVTIYGGQVGVDDEHRANIHGGGFGDGTTVGGNVTVTLGECNVADGATVFGDVYGGSALGNVNTNSSNLTKVSLNSGTVYGAIYGGGLGQVTPTSIAAAVNGQVEVVVTGGSIKTTSTDPVGEAGSGSVFGCNNINGRPMSSVAVDIYNTDQPLSGYALHAVYGGGNKSAYSGTPVVTIHGCNNSIEYVYGGGNAANVAGTNVTIWGGNIGNAFAGGNGFSAANPPNHNNPSGAHYNPGANITTNGTQLKIYGGTIGAAFGGSNQYGTIDNSISVTVEARTEEGSDPCGNAYGSCAMDIAELYGGGNEATIQMSNNDWITPTVTIGCNANIGMLFGGAKAADYTGNITLDVDGGTFNKVFGGNNKGGTITGNVTVNFKGGTAKEVYGGCNESGDIKGVVTVNIDENSSRCGVFYVENVYGGGNLAGYNPETARVGGDRLIPLVNIKNGTVQENVYGGGYGSTATITGNPVVTVGDSDNAKRASVKGSVFGGGNAAAIDGDTLVKILYKSRVYGNVYGGGNQGEVGGDTKVIVNGD